MSSTKDFPFIFFPHSMLDYIYWNIIQDFMGQENRDIGILILAHPMKQ